MLCGACGFAIASDRGFREVSYCPVHGSKAPKVLDRCKLCNTKLGTFHVKGPKYSRVKLMSPVTELEMLRQQAAELQEELNAQRL